MHLRLYRTESSDAARSSRRGEGALSGAGRARGGAAREYADPRLARALATVMRGTFGIRKWAASLKKRSRA